MRRRAPAPAIDDHAALGQLATALFNCRPAVLDVLTVADLCRRYRVSAKRAGYELNIARRKRAGEAR